MKLESTEFKNLFNKIKTNLHKSANFLFLDQFGVKEVTKDIFKSLFELSKTDFMFFVSSSSIKRFLRTPEFKALWFMDSYSIKSCKPKEIHRIIVKEYRKLAPLEAYVIPFTIKRIIMFMDLYSVLKIFLLLINF